MDLNEKKVLSLLGLAAKAGKTASGEFATEKSVKSGMARLVILAGDASANTGKKFRNMCAYYPTPVMEISDKETLGRAIGKEQRSCMAVEDEGFAAALRRAAGC